MSHLPLPSSSAIPRSLFPSPRQPDAVDDVLERRLVALILVFGGDGDEVKQSPVTRRGRVDDINFDNARNRRWPRDNRGDPFSPAEVVLLRLTLNFKIGIAFYLLLN